MAELLYGSGLRLMECLRLRVKDIDFGYNRITVRDGKGLRERVALLPQQITARYTHILRASKNCIGKISPAAAEKFTCRSRSSANIPTPRASGSGNTFFPRRNLALDPRSGEIRRHHVSEKNLQNAVKLAVRAAGISKAGELPHLPAQFCHASA